MTVRLYAFTCRAEFARLMEAGEGEITVPVPVFLIEHSKGRALFDTGLHPGCQDEMALQLGVGSSVESSKVDSQRFRFV